MQISPLGLAGAVLATPRRFNDSRGWFMESYRADLVDSWNEGRAFIQDNHVYTAARGTLRGMHFQRDPHAQAKLVRVLRGAIYDVIVDLRPGSPTRGRWIGVELTADSGQNLLAPRGFAHGYLTLTDDCEVFYKVDAPYAPSAEDGLCWNDPALRIDWPWPAEEIQAHPRDLAWPAFV